MNSAENGFCGEYGGEYMAITINARQFTVTPDIRTHVESALTPVINDQVLKVSSANVVIDYENKKFTVSLVVNCKYHVFTAKTTDFDCFKAFDLACDKVSAQLKTLHDKIVSHKGEALSETEIKKAAEELS